jgi:hypothetical protein
MTGMKIIVPVIAALAIAPTESVVLKPLHGSHVGGRITYKSSGKVTAATAKLTGVPAGAAVRVLLQAGTCRRHGASAAALRNGKIPVPISIVADGSHVFTVVVNGKEAACAAIPGLD